MKLNLLYDFTLKHIDKLLHFLVTFMLAIVFGKITLAIGIVVAVVLSIIKEIIDQLSYGGWSWLDLLADVLGIMFAIFIVLI